MLIARDEDGKFLDYTMPGCYPVFHICDDGGTLCPSCANDPKNPIHTDEPNDGWRIVGSDVNYEDPELFCDHCNRRIESAYAEEETDSRMSCNQCEMVSINGMACHETGCPNMHARWDADNGEWIKQRKCFECGNMVDEREPCCGAD